MLLSTNARSQEFEVIKIDDTERLVWAEAV